MYGSYPWLSAYKGFLDMRDSDSGLLDPDANFYPDIVGIPMYQNIRFQSIRVQKKYC